jgi:hypothetical protein
VAIIAVDAETTTARLRLVTNTAASPSHTLLIIILLRTVPRTILLIPLNLNGAQSMVILLMDMHKAPCLLVTITPTTPPNHTLLLNIHSSLLMAHHKPTPTKGRPLLTNPSGMLDSLLEAIMVEEDRVEATMIVMDQSPH